MGCVSTIVSGSPEDLSISHAQITGQTHFPTPLTFLKAATSSGTISFCSRAFIQTMQTVQSIAQSLPFDPCEFLVFPWMPQCLLAVPFLLQPVVSLSRTLLSQYLWWHTDLDFCVGHVNAFFFLSHLILSLLSCFPLEEHLSSLHSGSGQLQQSPPPIVQKAGSSSLCVSDNNYGHTEICGIKSNFI